MKRLVVGTIIAAMPIIGFGAATQDAIDVITLLNGGNTPTTQKLLNIANQFKVYAGDRCTYVDAENPTNDELGQCVLDELERFGRAVTRAVAENAERATQETDVTNAGDTAEADWD